MKRAQSILIAALALIIIASFASAIADLNNDGIVNMVDITIVTVAFGATTGGPRWDARADIDQSDIIDIVDVTMVVKDYGKTA